MRTLVSEIVFFIGMLVSAIVLFIGMLVSEIVFFIGMLVSAIVFLYVKIDSWPRQSCRARNIIAMLFPTLCRERHRISIVF